MKTLFRRTRRSWIMAFAATAALAACGTDSSTEPTIFGTYNSVSFNGHALPYSTTEDGVPVTFQSGALVLKSDHTFTVTFNSTATVGTQSVPRTESSSGTFSASGSNLTFIDASDGETTLGVLDGTTLTATNAEGVYVFRK